MEHYLQVLAILLEVDGLQLPRLIVGADVIIQREVTQAVEGDLRGVVGRHEVAAIMLVQIRGVGIEFYSRGYLRLVDQELHLLQVH